MAQSPDAQSRNAATNQANNAAAAKPSLMPASDWGKFALGYGALWVLLIAGVDAGWGELSAALALLIAGGAAIVYAPRALTNLGFGGQ